MSEKLIEIGRAIRRLPYTQSSVDLSAKGTRLLENCGDLSRAQLASICKFLGGALAAELPEIERLLGIPEGDFDHTVFYGRTQHHFTIYERTRNIRLYSDGSGAFETPTPSGQKLLIQPFNVKGEYAASNSRTRYVDMLSDEYGQVAGVDDGLGNTLRVYTHPKMRHVTVGCMGCQRDNNFAPMPSLVAMANAGRPGHVDMDAVNRLLGKWIHNPEASGWLVGFDQFAGEAIVSFEDFPFAGFERWRTNFVWKNLEGLYPIELRDWNGPSFTKTAYRNAIGQIFMPEPVAGGYKLYPTGGVMAFSPVEVSGLGLNSPNNLAEALGLDWTVGLRALGGFCTDRGGRIPLQF